MEGAKNWENGVDTSPAPPNTTAADAGRIKKYLSGRFCGFWVKIYLWIDFIVFTYYFMSVGLKYLSAMLLVSITAI